MSCFSSLDRWLSLVHRSQDEAAILEAWYAVNPHLPAELSELLAAGETATLERFWQALQSEEVLLFFDYLCSGSGVLRCSVSTDAVASLSLRRTLAARIVGAGIAAALITADSALLRTWLQRIDADASALPDLAIQPSAKVVGTLFRRLRNAGTECGEIEDWIVCLLRRHPTYRSASSAIDVYTPVSARRCPLLIHKQDRTGTVGWLTLEAFEARGGEIFPDSVAMGLTPLSHTFRSALAVSIDTAQIYCAGRLRLPMRPAVRWCIQSGREGWEGRQVLEGGSHGAAFAVALIQLLCGEPLDAGTALTMTLNAEGDFGPVTGVYAKVQAACALRDCEGKSRIRRVVVHPDNASEARYAATAAGRDPQEAIRVCRTLEEFLPEAGGILHTRSQRGLCRPSESATEARCHVTRASQAVRPRSAGNRREPALSGRRKDPVRRCPRCHAALRAPAA